MSVTKKSKKVTVTFVETKKYYAKYVCPSCRVEYIGACVDESTVSFKCDCGQVLVVESVAVASSGLTKRAPDACPYCLGKGEEPANKVMVRCRFCAGTGKRG